MTADGRASESPYPSSRRLTFDVGRIGRAKHRVQALLEVDVTDARSRLKELRRAGGRVPLPFVVRAADRKSLAQIRGEIDAAKAQAVEDDGDLVLGQRRDPLGMRWFLGLPQAWRLALMRALVLRSPQRTKATMGNVMVTTVGMAGRARGWIVPSSLHPLCVALGSLAAQPWLHRGEIRERMILRVTVLVDHDVVDGIPAARFVGDLVQRLERAEGL